MIRISRYLGVAVLLLGIVGVVIGIVFVAQGVAKKNMMQEEMRTEQVTYLLPEEEIAEGNVVDTAGEAQKVADTIRGHRHNIAPTYADLLAGGKYDPTNPTHLSYSQAMNMENYLYLAVVGFGLTDVVIASGIFMILMGLALGATGVTLYALTRRAQQVG